MGIFHPTGASLSSEGKRQSDYIQFRPYCAITAPPLLPQKRRDAFLASIGVPTKGASASVSVDAWRFTSTNRIAYVALAVLAVLVIVLGVLWRLHLL